MIYFILNHLKTSDHFKIPAVFTYYSTRMMLAAITSLLISIFLGPFFIRKLYELKVGQNIRREECPVLGELHAKKQNTPTMGGLLILFSMLVSMFLWMDLQSTFTLILLLTTVVLGFAGGLDDYLKIKHKNSKGLSGRFKLLAQVGLSIVIAAYLFFPGVSEVVHTKNWFAPPIIKESRAAALDFAVQDSSALPSVNIHGDEKKNHSMNTLTLSEYASRVYVPFFKDPVIIFSGFGIVLGFLFIILVVAGSSNSVNLTDGLDGLAAGCLLLVSISLALIAFVSNNVDIANYLHILYIEGSGEIAIYLCALAGGCLGFLWYNAHPAQIFMGDVGSLALGGIIGVSALLLKREILLIIIGGIFVAETFSVILQVGSYKLRNKKRIFLCTPLHHHFEYKGWHETKVVIRFWIVGFLLAIIGIATLKFQ